MASTRFPPPPISPMPSGIYDLRERNGMPVFSQLRQIGSILSDPPGVNSFYKLAICTGGGLFSGFTSGAVAYHYSWRPKTILSMLTKWTRVSSIGLITGFLYGVTLLSCEKLRGKNSAWNFFIAGNSTAFALIPFYGVPARGLFVGTLLGSAGAYWKVSMEKHDWWPMMPNPKIYTKDTYKFSASVPGPHMIDGNGFVYGGWDHK